MTSRSAASLVAFAFLLAACGREKSSEAAPPVAACARAETLAAYPNGAFLENLIVEGSGRVLFTDYLGKSIESFAPATGAARFVVLDAHPVSIAAMPEGYLVAAHGAPFTSGPAFTRTNKLLVLNEAGAVVRTIAAPDAKFLNGMGAMADGAFLIADSLAGVVWRFDPRTSSLRVWLAAPEFKPDETGADPRPGANGVEVIDGAVLISNSVRGALYRVAIDAAGAPSGAITEVARPGVIDDFARSADGVVYAATHTAKILRIAPDGAVSVVLPEGADGSTAVAFDGPDALYALTTGGLFEGGKAEAKLLRVALPGGDALCAGR